MKRLFNRRVLVRAFAALIILGVLLVVIENWTGTRALAAVNEQLQAEGETLDFTALLPQPLTDERNFCAIEPLAGLKDSKQKPVEALKGLDWTILSVEGMGSIRSASAPDLKPSMAHLAAKGMGKEDASPAEMLAVLDAAHPVLKSLADAASQRPAAQFLPVIGKGRPDIKHHEIDYTHLTHAQNLAKALLYRCNFAISAGNAGDALHGILGSLRLAEAHLQEPVLLGFLVGFTIQSTTMDRVWALLHARIATESELATLQKNIARLDLLAALPQASRGELAVTAHTMAALRARPELRSSLFGGPQKGWMKHQKPHGLMTCSASFPLPASLSIPKHTCWSLA